jgi:hypothetical protein
MRPDVGILVINRHDRHDRRRWMTAGVRALRQAGWDARFVRATDRDTARVPNGGACGSIDGVRYGAYVQCDEEGVGLGHEETVARLARDLDLMGAGSACLSGLGLARPDLTRCQRERSNATSGVASLDHDLNGLGHDLTCLVGVGVAVPISNVSYYYGRHVHAGEVAMLVSNLRCPHPN